jgi:hypothetical protein
MVGDDLEKACREELTFGFAGAESEGKFVPLIPMAVAF